MRCAIVPHPVDDNIDIDNSASANITAQVVVRTSFIFELWFSL
jgi:hypothetical protein